MILDGSLLPRDSWDPGLKILSSHNTIRALEVVDFPGYRHPGTSPLRPG